MNCPVCNEILPEGSICCPVCGEHIASKLQQNKVKEAKANISGKIEEAFSSPVFKTLIIIMHLISAVCIAQLTLGVLSLVKKGGIFDGSFPVYATSALFALVFLVTSLITSIFAWRLTLLKNSKNTDLIGTQKIINLSARIMHLVTMIVGVAAIVGAVFLCLMRTYQPFENSLANSVFTALESLSGKDLQSILGAQENQMITVVILLIVLVASLVVWVVACCVFIGAYKRVNRYYGKITDAYWRAEYDEKRTPATRCFIIGALEIACGVLPMIPVILAHGKPVFGLIGSNAYLPAAILISAVGLLFGLHLILTGVIFLRVHKNEIEAIAVYRRESDEYEKMETRTRLELAEYDRVKRKAEFEAEEKKRRELEDKEARIRLNTEKQQQMMQALLLKMMEERLGPEAVKKFVEGDEQAVGADPDADPVNAGTSDAPDAPDAPEVPDLPDVPAPAETSADAPARAVLSSLPDFDPLATTMEIPAVNTEPAPDLPDVPEGNGADRQA